MNASSVKWFVVHFLYYLSTLVFWSMSAPWFHVISKFVKFYITSLTWLITTDLCSHWLWNVEFRIAMWNSQMRIYRVPNVDNFKDARSRLITSFFYLLTGHFSQLVWKETDRCGFGKASTPDGKRIYVVGRYQPPGNVEGEYKKNVLPLGSKVTTGESTISWQTNNTWIQVFLWTKLILN